MRLLSLCVSLTAVTLASARSFQHVGKKGSQLPRRQAEPIASSHEPMPRSATSKYLTDKTQKFVVNGSAIPDVDFDIGESYAGLLPISDEYNASELYFWFFPSPNPAADKEILIWLNGGPGCSSLEGFLQENGPVLWQYGTFKPVQNPWTWVNLTNVVWVEQPVGTGFTQGTVTATDEADVAEQFLGFFKNFVDTFCMQGYTVYITGESYAGYYVPYIADAMFNKEDKEYYNLSSTMVYDGVYSYDVIGSQMPTVPFLEYWRPLLGLNDTFMDQIHDVASTCGYEQYLEDNLVFPPTGPLPVPPNEDGLDSSCDVFNMAINAISLVNPCFDVYQVATTCPLLWDVLGFPGSFGYLPDGAEVYFNRTEVQKAINAPLKEWEECSSINVFVDVDQSLPSGLTVLPSVIERSQRTVLGHGILDMILQFNGTLLGVQNMTWNGAQGFSSGPSDWDDFYVPYHNQGPLGTIAGAGVMGQYHTERNLTVVSIQLSGHMVPQYAPSAAYRHVEYLLGRIPDLGSTLPFTTE